MEEQLIAIMTAALLQAGIIEATTPAAAVPIFRQGSLGESEIYPDTFLTFWNGGEAESTAYDNDTATVVWRFDVNAYSTDAGTVYSLTDLLRHLLKRAGWQTPDRGHDVASDEITHTGRGISVTYLKTLQPNAEPEPTPTPTPTPEPEAEQEPGPQPTN